MMKLALPLGLLALLFIVGLILIYILKPKYQDKKVASTYVWKLSLKYAKRKVPWQWLRNSLLFLVQLLIFAILAFMLARPYIVLATTQGEKIVILDASASMNAQLGDTTRFDRAKNEISALAEVTTPDDSFTIILATEDASFVVRRTDSIGFIKQKLSETDCTLTEPNFSSAMQLAEIVLEENPNAEVHLYTDTDYQDSGRVIVHNMSSGEWNAAILNFTASRVNGKYVFSAEIASYGKSAEIAVSLSVDGKTQAPKLATCNQNGTSVVTWDNLNVSSYANAEVHLQGVADSFPYDNDFSIYNTNAERFQVQLVSDDPGFLQRALLALGTCDVVIPNENLPAETQGFDLYIFDGVLPQYKPTDGAVWLINPPYSDSQSATMLSSEWGISFSGKNSGEFNLASAGGSSETFNTIMRGVAPSTILVTEYSEIGDYEGYESLMMCDNNPVLLAKDDNGLKTIVLAFDIHMSDIGIRYSFPMLVSNICRYTLSPIVDDTLYTVGDTVRINAKPNTSFMTVNIVYTDGSEEWKNYSTFPVDFNVSAPGTYTVFQQLRSGRTVTATFYARIALNESIFEQTETTLVNPVVFTDVGTDTTVDNDTLEIFIYLAAAMIVLFCIEWGLQYREQF